MSTFGKAATLVLAVAGAILIAGWLVVWVIGVIANWSV